MDEILYLEPDEEITTVIDKLKKTETHSVGLVIPRSATLIQSLVNLKLLKKEAEKAGKEIALVTNDKVGKHIASQVGITVFDDVHAKKPASSFAPPDLPKGDEVIEVDMSTSKAKAGPNNGDPKVTHYSGQLAPSKSRTESGEESRSPSPHAAQVVEASRTGHHSAHRSGSSTKRGQIIAVGLFLVIIGATIFGLPQTSIIVTVAAETFEKAIPLTVDSKAKQADPGLRTIPGKLITVTNDDGRRVVATGKKDVGTKTKGSVVLYNAWQSEPLKLTAGSSLASVDGKNFTLANDVTIPGVTLELKEGQLVTRPGTVAANITATEPGESYNVKAGRFNLASLPDKQQEKVYGESTKDFSGGASKTVSVMTQSDIDNAKNGLAEDLNKQATEELKKNAKNLKLIDEAIIHELEAAETSPSQVDSETDYFDIKVKAKHLAIVFDEQQLQSVVDKALKAEIPEDKELLLDGGDEFVIAVTSPDYAEEKLGLESKIKTKIGTRVDPTAAKRGLNGRTTESAREQLSRIPTVKAVEIYPFPNWWWQDISWLPWNTRLKVIYE